MPGVVSNSSPLIHLAKIREIEILKVFYQRILIPESVYHECVTEGKNREDALLIRQADWIEVRSVRDERLVRALQQEIDRGEAKTIVLALEVGADLVLLDDYEARQKARLYNLRITGTLGVPLRAKHQGKLASLKGAMEKLKEAGFRIGGDLEQKILREAREG